MRALLAGKHAFPARPPQPQPQSCPVFANAPEPRRSRPSVQANMIPVSWDRVILYHLEEISPGTWQPVLSTS